MEKYTTTIPRLKDINKAQRNKRHSQRQAYYMANDTHSGQVMKFYWSAAWRNTRDAHLRQHPIDELQILSHYVYDATDVHHIIKFADQPTDELKWMLLTDDDNLLSLTAHTHQCVHYNKKELTQEMIDLINRRKQHLLEKYISMGYQITMTDD